MPSGLALHVPGSINDALKAVEAVAELVLNSGENDNAAKPEIANLLKIIRNDTTNQNHSQKCNQLPSLCIYTAAIIDDVASTP